MTNLPLSHSLTAYGEPHDQPADEPHDLLYLPVRQKTHLQHSYMT
jgi:hypothetical protein